ncbi:hypothetical protein [Bacteroides congonensis]|uniref:hypothetical protein n=1 Tax=Bacteroides congonensis TaxID=1871006 RepID=UPI00255B2E5B|nr:hypothetical protein [Bacteroides congonensis]
MKRNIIYMVGALLSSAILTFSCSDDDAPTYSEMAVDKTDIFIQADGEHPTAEVNITNGNGNYKITVADENIATATLDGTRVIINGLKNGTTTATVMDWTKHSAVINIKVKEDFELKLSQEEVTLFLNEEKKNTALVNIVSGNGDYQVESSNSEVATAELTTEGKILITALSSDFCDVTVTDADGKKATVKVGVCDEHLALEDITGKVCVATQTLDIAVASGNGEYSVVSENPEIATAEIVDEVVRVTGVSKGEAAFTVTDRMKLTTTIKVLVAGGFEIETTQIDNLWIGEALEIPIIDGSRNYTIDAGAYMKCTLSEDKSKLIVEGLEGKRAVNQTIKVTDNIFEKTIEISVGEVYYRFEAYSARWYIQGTYQMGIPHSTISTDNGREHIKVATGKTWTGALKDGFHISFEGGRTKGKKTSLSQLVQINSSGRESNICAISDLEIIEREYTNDTDEADGKGKFWIRFKEECKDEYSYIITWF